MDKRRDAYLRRHYGINLDQYNDILRQQGGGCALCGKTPEEEGRNLAVDHNHSDLTVRGVLCTYCNHRIVGRHRDPELLERVAEYLRRDTGFKAPGNRKKKRKRNTRAKKQ